jgi:hypothetical protein
MSPLALRPLGAILGTTLATCINARRIECASDDVIANTRQILDTTAANQHDRVLLQGMTFAGNVTRDLNPIRETNTGNLPQSRVRLLWRRGIHTYTNTTLLRALL